MGSSDLSAFRLSPWDDEVVVQALFLRKAFRLDQLQLVIWNDEMKILDQRLALEI